MRGFLTFLPKAIRADLIHLHMAERGSVLRKLILLGVARGLGKPAILHAHGAEFVDFMDGLPAWTRTAVLRGLNASTRFAVLSAREAKCYRDQVGVAKRRLTVLPNPVEWDRKLPERAGQRRIHFIFLGKIGERKGAFDLLEAFSLLEPDLLASARLTLAGNGELARARRRVTELGLTEQVTVPGWIDPDARSQLLEQGSVFVLPSFREALPMALLEAMAAGLAVIATPVGGIPDLIEHEKTGLLVAPGDVPSLRTQMERLATREPLRLALGMAAHARAETCSLPHFRTALGGLYRSVIQESRDG
jgi:glycosyltransferase involved in cell wall biosynthesis